METIEAIEAMNVMDKALNVPPASFLIEKNGRARKI